MYLLVQLPVSGGLTIHALRWTHGVCKHVAVLAVLLLSHQGCLIRFNLGVEGVKHLTSVAGAWTPTSSPSCSTVVCTERHHLSIAVGHVSWAFAC